MNTNAKSQFTVYKCLVQIPGLFCDLTIPIPYSRLHPTNLLTSLAWGAGGAEYRFFLETHAEALLLAYMLNAGLTHDLIY